MTWARHRILLQVNNDSHS